MQSIYESEQFQKILHKGAEKFSQLGYNKESLRIELENFMGKRLDDDNLKTLIMPWITALHFIQVVEDMNIHDEQNIYINELRSSVNKLLRLLERFRGNSDALKLLALIHGIELDFDMVTQVLHNIKMVCNKSLEMKKLGKGQDFNSDVLEEFGVFCTFEIGLKMNIPHGRPSKLFEFTKIITRCDRRYLSDKYRKFKTQDMDKLTSENGFFQHIR